PGDWPPQRVTANGVALGLVRNDDVPGWTFEGNTLTTVVTVPRTSVHNRTHVVITRAAGSSALRQQLDGFAGSISRLRGAYDTINAILAFAQPRDTLIDAMQTGDRIHYRPETARMEVARFPGIYERAIADVQALVDRSNLPEDQLEDRISKEPNPSMSVQDRAKRYKLYLGRAKALLEDGAPKQ
ncbi:MAG: alpha-glucosidase, partial [Acidobacteriaceae bacterium]|nr:alpha-glucosidase [Acidobacteriaceae bacterium]